MCCYYALSRSIPKSRRISHHIPVLASVQTVLVYTRRTTRELMRTMWSESNRECFHFDKADTSARVHIQHPVVCHKVSLARFDTILFANLLPRATYHSCDLLTVSSGPENWKSPVHVLVSIS